MTDEHAHEERETDDISDAQVQKAYRDICEAADALRKPLTQAEIDATIRRVSREIEAIGNEQSQPLAD